MTNPLHILFHNEKPFNGHYEPLLYKKIAQSIVICNEDLSPPCKDLQTYWEIMNDKMLGHRLHKATNTISICGDSMFFELCHLIAPDFDVESLRLCIVESFCNSIICNANIAFHCLQKYISKDVIKTQKESCKLANITYQYGNAI